MTEFICDTLTNTCGADQTAKTTCATATAAAAAQASGTGAQADAFNNVFGITTVCSSTFTAAWTQFLKKIHQQFSSVAQVDNQGNVVAGSTVSLRATHVYG